jgi:hypothetical protein
MKITKFIAGIRFFMLIPIVGLAVAGFVLFFEGSIELVHGYFCPTHPKGILRNNKYIISNIFKLFHGSGLFFLK